MAYFENNQSISAFTTDQLTILELLISQAAISIENSNLYQELEQRVEERTRELKETQAALISTARQIGMAEISTNVLRNVDNTLNSINGSASLMINKLRTSKAHELTQAIALIHQHQEDLSFFFTQDPEGKGLPSHLDKLSKTIKIEQMEIIEDLGLLINNVERIKHVMRMQQSYAGLEKINIIDIVEDALQMTEESQYHHVKILKFFEDIPILWLDKTQTLQILIHLINNAKQATTDREDRLHQITIRVERVDNNLRVSVEDNGQGIALENLSYIFTHSLTTCKGAHSFRLYSCALAAKRMGGTLTVHSDGLNKGAIFTLELPINTPAE